MGHEALQRRTESLMVASCRNLQRMLPAGDRPTIFASPLNAHLLPLSFKCGHDAPVYSVVERIIEQSGTQYFCFKDLNENKPIASIKLRVETIDYFLISFGDTVQFGKQIVRNQLGSGISLPLNVGINSASRMPIADEE